MQTYKSLFCRRVALKATEGSVIFIFFWVFKFFYLFKKEKEKEKKEKDIVKLVACYIGHVVDGT